MIRLRENHIVIGRWCAGFCRKTDACTGVGTRPCVATLPRRICVRPLWRGPLCDPRSYRGLSLRCAFLAARRPMTGPTTRSRVGSTAGIQLLAGESGRSVLSVASDGTGLPAPDLRRRTSPRLGAPIFPSCSSNSSLAFLQPSAEQFPQAVRSTLRSKGST